uniref:Uncharacterized protein n=1 Tax=Chromera velia CCMP2878 TaxID=1169474 RepID=A0A0G4IAS5_9ALVE|eukprot:Cvel_12541.t1-p1 / transcript=Cvel_12541.t1 / gene=Cvel_12541 / organism=Chromera_velia_CCMP2878 / gene_product=hypothetical protein / transcript_product=hypothetical protein / location=Cvel_scaffold824:17044-19781(+) / protein_length=670 / sequence_SO=supercontig / SO=protein_coding / is_pseudo=false
MFETLDRSALKWVWPEVSLGSAVPEETETARRKLHSSCVIQNEWGGFYDLDAATSFALSLPVRNALRGGQVEMTKRHLHRLTQLIEQRGASWHTIDTPFAWGLSSISSALLTHAAVGGAVLLDLVWAWSSEMTEKAQRIRGAEEEEKETECAAVQPVITSSPSSLLRAAARAAARAGRLESLLWLRERVEKQIWRDEMGELIRIAADGAQWDTVEALSQSHKSNSGDGGKESVRAIAQSLTKLAVEQGNLERMEWLLETAFVDEEKSCGGSERGKEGQGPQRPFNFISGVGRSFSSSPSCSSSSAYSASASSSSSSAFSFSSSSSSSSSSASALPTSSLEGTSALVTRSRSMSECGVASLNAPSDRQTLVEDLRKHSLCRGFLNLHDRLSTYVNKDSSGNERKSLGGKAKRNEGEKKVGVRRRPPSPRESEKGTAKTIAEVERKSLPESLHQGGGQERGSHVCIVTPVVESVSGSMCRPRSDSSPLLPPSGPGGDRQREREGMAGVSQSASSTERDADVFRSGLEGLVRRLEGLSRFASDETGAFGYAWRVGKGGEAGRIEEGGVRSCGKEKEPKTDSLSSTSSAFSSSFSTYDSWRLELERLCRTLATLHARLSSSGQLRQRGKHRTVTIRTMSLLRTASGKHSVKSAWDAAGLPIRLSDLLSEWEGSP